jgi:MFS family permease
VHGYSATAAGAAVVPVVVLIFLLSRYTGGLADRFGARFPLVVGPAIAAAGFALFAVPGIEGTYWTTFFPATVVLGVGLAVLVPAVTTVALNSVEASHSGLASAINNAFAQVAGLLAVTALGVLMFTVFDGALDARLAELDLTPAARAEIGAEKVELGAAQAPEGLDAQAGAAVERAFDEAFLSGYRAVMLVVAAAASTISAALWIEGKKKVATELGEKTLAA